MHEIFRKFAFRAAEITGLPITFIIAMSLIASWLISGIFIGFQSGWSTVLNTGTTVITFLLVLLLQNTQTRDSKATHLKLDELIRALKGTRNKMLSLEHLTELELLEMQDQFEKLRTQETETLEIIKEEIIKEENVALENLQSYLDEKPSLIPE